jgi:hypothetical protein
MMLRVLSCYSLIKALLVEFISCLRRVYSLMLSFSATEERESYPFFGFMMGLLRGATLGGMGLGLKGVGREELVLKNMFLKTRL